MATNPEAMETDTSPDDLPASSLFDDADSLSDVDVAVLESTAARKKKKVSEETKQILKITKSAPLPHQARFQL
ncbi:hypothetical protein PtA15_17A117 [Puccinia triticina]|uniref:Uncharacterized protein n=1 Tax=Puccinia triticina TaxID=208348 RepID=A0ABY7D5Y2_9BASI|nr:uncharacterized protein PtA15_17A117 [Puccinia triticina]WAQ92635.1 hypothetical protein PtA15_17A117 [Puccinia triticina]